MKLQSMCYIANYRQIFVSLNLLLPGVDCSFFQRCIPTPTSASASPFFRRTDGWASFCRRTCCRRPTGFVRSPTTTLQPSRASLSASAERSRAPICCRPRSKSSCQAITYFGLRVLLITVGRVGLHFLKLFVKMQLNSISRNSDPKFDNLRQVPLSLTNVYNQRTNYKTGDNNIKSSVY